MSVNKVILIGNLGKDVELKTTPAGVSVATFSLATSEKWKDKDGTQQEKTEWHNVVMWRGLAEVAARFLSKGKKVYLEGKMQTRTYDDRDGNTKYITEIVADKMDLIDSSGQQPPQQTQQQTQQQPTSGAWGSDDDFPF